jgi:hypothetical protein
VNGACMPLFLNEVVARDPNERIGMVVDGAGWHKSGQFPLPPNLRLLPLPPNGIRSSISGTNCGRRLFTSGCLTVSMRWKTTWSTPCGLSKTIRHACIPSPPGLGLLMHYRLKNGISTGLSPCAEITESLPRASIGTFCETDNWHLPR